MIVTIEGGDQAGKKTQTALLKQALKKRKIKTTTFSFPDYATPIGQEIRKYLDGKRRFPPQVIHCLLAANRWEKLYDIQQAKKKYSVIIMNRYYHSNLVYGLANGMQKEWLKNLDFGLPKSDLVILLDVSQKESFQRKKLNRDKFEKDIEFSQNVSRIYERVAKQQKWKIINASQTKEQIHKEILRAFVKKTGL